MQINSTNTNKMTNAILLENNIILRAMERAWQNPEYGNSPKNKAFVQSKRLLADDEYNKTNKEKYAKKFSNNKPAYT